MNRTRLWVAAAIIAGVVLVTFLLSVPHVRDVDIQSQNHVAATSTPVVTLRDTYKKGTHTLSGSVQVPNACTSISAEASPVGTASSTDAIYLAITWDVDLGVCLQESTTVTFQSVIAAPANIPIQATVNGVPASTTLP